MNPREKRLLVIVGSLLALALIYQIGSWYNSSLDELEKRIGVEENNLQRILEQRKLVNAAIVAWNTAGQQTLSLTLNQAQTALRPEIHRLVEKAGLTKPTVVIKPPGREGKNGIMTLPCTVTADGRLENIVQFFFQLHQQPYMVRCKKLRLDQPTDKKSPKDVLKMTADLDTLILPTPKEMPPPKPPALADDQRRVIIRTAATRPEDYATLLSKRMFEQYVPPLPPADKVVGHKPSNDFKAFNASEQLSWQPANNARTYELYFSAEGPDKLTKVNTTGVPNFRYPMQVNKQYWWRVDSINAEGKRTQGDVMTFTTAPEAPKPPTGDLDPVPPWDAELLLARTLGSLTGGQVVLEDPRNKALPDVRVQVGEELYGGTLVYVHPKGAVSEKGEELRFHPLSAQLKTAQPLSDAVQPEVYYEVMKLEAQARSISQAGG